MFIDASCHEMIFPVQMWVASRAAWMSKATPGEANTRIREEGDESNRPITTQTLGRTQQHLSSPTPLRSSRSVDIPTGVITLKGSEE